MKKPNFYSVVALAIVFVVAIGCGNRVAVNSSKSSDPVPTPEKLVLNVPELLGGTIEEIEKELGAPVEKITDYNKPHHRLSATFDYEWGTIYWHKGNKGATGFDVKLDQKYSSAVEAARRVGIDLQKGKKFNNFIYQNVPVGDRMIHFTWIQSETADTDRLAVRTE